jgi:hypothetical protein
MEGCQSVMAEGLGSEKSTCSFHVRKTIWNIF